MFCKVVAVLDGINKNPILSKDEFRTQMNNFYIHFVAFGEVNYQRNSEYFAEFKEKHGAVESKLSEEITEFWFNNLRNVSLKELIDKDPVDTLNNLFMDRLHEAYLWMRPMVENDNTLFGSAF